MDKFVDFFNTPKRGLTNTQKNKMLDGLAKIARQLVDAKGNKIFRASNVTGEIQLANGQSLPKFDLDRIKYSSNADYIDNQEKISDNKNKVTNEYKDIPQRAGELVQRIVSNENFKVSPLDDVDMLCDKVLASVKNAVERQFHLHKRAKTLAEQQRHLNLGAFYLGMVDEIRSDFNAGGQTYKVIIGSRSVRESARAGSNLAKSIQARGQQISNDEKIAVKSAAATNGFSEDIKDIVNDVRKQDRGDGIKFSYGKHSSQGAFSNVKYSIGSNDDNSAESITEKIRNKLYSIFKIRWVIIKILFSQSTIILR